MPPRALDPVQTNQPLRLGRGGQARAPVPSWMKGLGIPIHEILMHTRSSETKQRLLVLAGLAGILGGVAVALAYGLHPPESSPETVASPMWAWVHVLFLVSLICGVFLLQGLLARFLNAGGEPIGVLWYVLAVISLLLILGLDYTKQDISFMARWFIAVVVARYGDGVAMPSLAFVFPASGPRLQS